MDIDMASPQKLRNIVLSIVLRQVGSRVFCKDDIEKRRMDLIFVDPYGSCSDRVVLYVIHGSPVRSVGSIRQYLIGLKIQTNRGDWFWHAGTNEIRKSFLGKKTHPVKEFPIDTEIKTLTAYGKVRLWSSCVEPREAPVDMKVSGDVIVPDGGSIH